MMEFVLGFLMLGGGVLLALFFIKESAEHLRKHSERQRNEFLAKQWQESKDLYFPSQKPDPVAPDSPSTNSGEQKASRCDLQTELPLVRRDAQKLTTGPSEESRLQEDLSKVAKPPASPPSGIQDSPTPLAAETEEEIRYKEHFRLLQEYELKAKPLLNKTEKASFWALWNYLKEELPGEGLFIYPQVSMGELFKWQDEELTPAVNSKRVDFCIADSSFIPLAVLEINGSGHTTSRDKVKELACEKAGIRYVGIDVPKADEGEIKRLLKLSSLASVLRWTMKSSVRSEQKEEAG